MSHVAHMPPCLFSVVYAAARAPLGFLVFTTPHCENACNATQLGITAIRLRLGGRRRLRFSGRRAGE